MTYNVIGERHHRSWPYVRVTSVLLVYDVVGQLETYNVVGWQESRCQKRAWENLNKSRWKSIFQYVYIQVHTIQVQAWPGHFQVMTLRLKYVPARVHWHTFNVTWKYVPENIDSSLIPVTVPVTRTVTVCTQYVLGTAGILLSFLPALHFSPPSGYNSTFT